MQDLATIPARGAKGIAVAAAAVTTFAALAWFGSYWQIGDMIAKVTRPFDPEATRLADAAVDFAPGNAAAASLRAEIGSDPLSEDRRTAVEVAEEAVRNAPYDHRWRITLARVLADAGQIDRANAEFRRAIDLAPSYAVCRWFYGNFLLRQGRRDEAIAQFTVAAADNPEYREQVLALLWDYSQKDPSVLEAVAGDGVDSIASLAYFFAAHGRGEEALRNWNRLDPPGKSARMYLARAIAQGLFDQRRFRTSLEFSRQTGIDAEARFETVTNPSFETTVDTGPETKFGWRIVRGDPKFDVGTDTKVGHEGTRSLRLTFRGTARQDLFNAAQTIAVTPAARYRVSFWLRTENLKAAAGPVVDVSTGDEANSLARTRPFPSGTNDWQQLTLDFTVPATVDGIEIRTLRTPCNGDDCPISGTVWYDHFILTRIQ